MFDELQAGGFDLSPVRMGGTSRREESTCSACRPARLLPGEKAIVEATGLCTPYSRLNRIQDGLMEATKVRAGRTAAFKAGIRTVVLVGGKVRAGDPIRVALPPEPHVPLSPV